MPAVNWNLFATSTAHARLDNQYDYIELEAAAFAADGQLAVADEEGMIWLANTSAGQLEAPVSGSIAKTSEGDWEARALAWTAQDQLLACLGLQRMDDGQLESWLVVVDVQTLVPVDRKRISTVGTDGDITVMSWAQRGEIYALLDTSHQVVLRRQSDSQITRIIPRGTDPTKYDLIQCIALSPDGTQLATAATCAHVQVWPLAQGVPGEPVRLTLPLPAALASSGLEEDSQRWCKDIAWSPDGSKLACSDAVGHVWWWPAQGIAQNAAPGRAFALDHPYREGRTEFARWFLSVRYLAWSWDSQWLAGVDDLGRMHVWHPGADRSYATLPVHLGGRLWRPAWGPNGLVAVPGELGEVHLWSVRGDE